MKNRFFALVCIILQSISTLSTAQINSQKSNNEFITLASTTSTEQSGLFKHLLPLFEAQAGFKVRVVAVGTGQALALGRKGDADVVLVHDAALEEQFVAQGFGVKRFEVMFNDFVLVGPLPPNVELADSKVAGKVAGNMSVALRSIASARSPFVSRGDQSGTHAAELRLWRAAGVDESLLVAPWYRSVGQGMGPALNTAAAMNAFVLADRSTWLAFKNRGQLTIVVQGDPSLRNPYGVMLVNPAKHPNVKAREGQQFVDWLVSPAGQAAIASYVIGGEQVFFPRAK
jgi:tungstate transport system substrate-binding protein